MAVSNNTNNNNTNSKYSIESGPVPNTSPCLNSFYSQSNSVKKALLRTHFRYCVNSRTGIQTCPDHLTIGSFKLEVLGVCMALKAYILSFVLHSHCDLFSRLPIYRNPKLNLRNMTSSRKYHPKHHPGPCN